MENNSKVEFKPKQTKKQIQQVRSTSREKPNTSVGWQCAGRKKSAEDQYTNYVDDLERKAQAEEAKW